MLRTVLLRPMPSGGYVYETSARLNTEGAFAVSLPAGEYRVNVWGVPKDSFIQSILYGTSDVTNIPVKISGAAKMLVTLGTR